MPSADSLWYKDAVFYELHVKAFQDSSGDGIGDFGGLVERLDYLQRLGVDCIWLLPFYPSPLRDDGYDIADYYGVNPQYGNLEDLQRFLDEAHQRGLRVIADLVLNHTSDQHPWFQRARRSPKGSPERDYYVWSDTDEDYHDARIIFTDTEPSNWTWDPVAGQYYWHRFFRHQPDLNWDNPQVKEEMFRVMEFWLERGLDGFRCDAVPYLIEREGTSSENLPETHAILKEFRARMSSRYPDRILLAEANQWPDDVRPYFGDGDEFHMAFHFPLMPRIFMAVRRGERTPIVDIIERTPAIPPDCQWCMFLRNHDELTLEMVTDEERDYMYREYAADPRMRINLGIRRRLAPLMDNDRRKIELLNSILLTMPGSPVIYYGDEIGMGDNIWLGDRDGVRTPMQWSPDRNAGFSRADPARLYLPPISDSLYGFQSINVEAQERSPFSLLNWMKRIIQVRKQHHAFGRGTIDFLHPENEQVLAYVRELGDDAILVVNNLANTAQAVSLDLNRFADRIPVELLGRSEFPCIDASPYALTLAPYGFFWFSLRPVPQKLVLDDETLRRVTQEWAERDAGIFADPVAVATIVTAIPPDWLASQRWFRDKAREITALELVDHASLIPEQGARVLLAIVRVTFASGEPELYFLPLTLRPPVLGDLELKPLTTVATAWGEVELYEALQHRYPAGALLRKILEEGELLAMHGSYLGEKLGSAEIALDGVPSLRMVGVEQSNTSIILGERIILKFFRRLEVGDNPDLEVSRFLLEKTQFRSLPGFFGSLDYRSEAGLETSVAGIFEFVPRAQDTWSYTQMMLNRFLAAAGRSAADPASLSGQTSLRRMAGAYIADAASIGELTGRLHLALASAGPDSPEFEPEAITLDHVQHWMDEGHAEMARTLGDLSRRLDTIPGAFPVDQVNQLADLVRDTPNLRQKMEGLRLLVDAGAVRTRIHGDYHLGQVLRREHDGAAEYLVIDFEGEPNRPLEQRRGKFSPLRDVAGMLRSFDYAVHMALAENRTPDLVHQNALRGWSEAWLYAVRTAFLDRYRETIGDSLIAPPEPAAFREVLAIFELEKAVYELGYEMNNRPGWIWIPMQGIRTILGGQS
jgi:maltose alpha-D-glucosyltransferase/alpha-amylase